MLHVLLVELYFLREGYYQLANHLVFAKQINIAGEGANRTIIKTANAYGLDITADNVTLKGFTVDGNAQTDGRQWFFCIGGSNCSFISLEDIEAKNGGYYGINMYQVNNASIQNISAHDNWRHGVHSGTDVEGRNKYNTYRNISAWNNGVDGFDERGNDSGNIDESCYNIYDNIQGLDNGGYGIVIGGQKDGVLSNSFASGNGTSGMYLYKIKDFNITDVIVKNNKTGIVIYNGSELLFTSCQSYDDRDTPIQQYGIQLTDSNTDISLLNCKLTPNSLGEIYNTAGAVVTVITDKMLAKF